jgi:hypothetical protein
LSTELQQSEELLQLLQIFSLLSYIQFVQLKVCNLFKIIVYLQPNVVRAIAQKESTVRMVVA